MPVLSDGQVFVIIEPVMTMISCFNTIFPTIFVLNRQRKYICSFLLFRFTYKPRFRPSSLSYDTVPCTVYNAMETQHSCGSVIN